MTGSARAPSFQPARRRILVVDDDDDIREAVAGVLGRAGYDVAVTSNGKEALAVLGQAPADLIVLDLRMPIMDGWEFIALRQRDAALASIPVVAISADGSPRAAAVQADSYLRKPFDLQDLLATIDRLLSGQA